MTNRCRDCADNFGTCPHDGTRCDSGRTWPKIAPPAQPEKQAAQDGVMESDEERGYARRLRYAVQWDQRKDGFVCVRKHDLKKLLRDFDAAPPAPSQQSVQVAQGDKRPQVPSNIIAAIQAYGDLRADGFPYDAINIGATIGAIRDWGASLAQQSLQVAKGGERAAKMREFEEWLNYQRDCIVSERFHEIVAHAAALARLHGQDDHASALRR